MAPFPPGSLVRMRLCPYGEPGVVLRTERSRVLVEWRDLGITRRHAAEVLMVAGPPAPSSAGRTSSPSHNSMLPLHHAAIRGNRQPPPGGR
jgi:hypothetical protein